MTSQNKPVLVLVGFSRDIERLLAVVDQKMVDVRLVHGKSDAGSIPSKADLVAYVWSEDTSWSTGLYSMFTYVHHFVKANEEYDVYLDGAVRLRGVMPSFLKLPPLPEERLAEQTLRAAAPEAIDS